MKERYLENIPSRKEIKIHAINILETSSVLARDEKKRNLCVKLFITKKKTENKQFRYVKKERKEVGKRGKEKLWN